MSAVNDLLKKEKNTVILAGENKVKSLTAPEISIIHKRINEQKNEKINLLKDTLWN